MGLFAVLVEVDGAGIPVAYLLCEVAPNRKGEKKAESGAMVYLLQQFLSCLKGLGFEPSFIGHDKDAAEIAAIRIVWPTSSLRLCYWHAKRAILKKMQDSDKTASQSQYYPGEVEQLVPGFEICWGSEQIRRPDGPHRRGTCSCTTKDKSFATKGRLETKDKKERDVVAGIFSRHLNSHPAFPDINGICKDSQVIYRESVQEIYAWCRAKGYFRLFAYLWNNWYKYSQWETWARAASPEIPVLKTTMVVEAHWRTVKHDYLHRFNRPRIDLVVWILLTKVVRDSLHRLDRIVKKERREGGASWRKQFKSIWKKMEAAEVDRDDITRYHTDPFRFVCACSSFLHGRFLICKHLVYCFKPIPDMANFYYDIKRHRTAPFWTSQQLQVREELLHLFSRSESEETVLDDATEFMEDVEDVGVGPDEYMDREEEVDIRESNEQKEEAERERGKRFIENMKTSLEVFTNQFEMGNTDFTSRFMNFHRRLDVSGEEFRELQKSRRMPKMWHPYKDPSTRFICH